MTSCLCVVIDGRVILCRVHAAAFDMLDACKMVDIYFKALCEQWAANDGRVVSKRGTVINASKDVAELCEVAARKVSEAISKAVE
jgi:hypothetical protein